MTQEQQSEALQLAEVFERFKGSSHRWTDGQPIHVAVAAELRRLYSENDQLRAQLAAQARHPLTIGEILSMDIRGTQDEALRFARSIEGAHGINDPAGD